MVERLREQLSTEKLKDRLDRLLADAEAALVSSGNSAASTLRARPRRPRARALASSAAGNATKPPP